MSFNTSTKKRNKSLESLLKELIEIKNYLRKLWVIIPEESLKDYKNPSRSKKAYQKVIKSFPPSS